MRGSPRSCEAAAARSGRREGGEGARKECVVFASGETNAFKRRGTQWRRDEIRFAGGVGRPGGAAGGRSLIDSRRATAGRLRRIGDSSGPIKLPSVEKSCTGHARRRRARRASCSGQTPVTTITTYEEKTIS